MVVALKTRRRSTLKVLRYVATGILVVAALVAARLAPQLPFPQVSESMGNHDSKIVDAGGVD
jgi:hypothetical protein